MQTVYRVRNLTRTYKQGQVLANDDLSFDIAEGEVFGLLGPNGAGKTTLVKQLSGLLRPTSGELSLFGHDLAAGAAVVPTYVSYLAQKPLALFSMRVWEAITVTGHLRGLTWAEARRQAGDLMEELGISDLARRIIRKLSGGQQRLVGFATALVGRRPVYIFDEPTNELDPEHRRLVWEKLLALNREGATLIIVTHNVLEAERVLGRVGIINHGRIMALGTVGELKSRVDQRIRLELLFKPGTAAQRQQALLSGLTAEVTPIGANQWQAFVPRDQLAQGVGRVLAEVDMDVLDDFRLISPSLEDVYIQLGGGERLVAEGD